MATAEHEPPAETTRTPRRPFSKHLSLPRVAILVLAAAFTVLYAIPALQKGNQKYRFEEVLALSEEYKADVAACYQETNQLSECDNGRNGVRAAPRAGENVRSVTVRAGVITGIATPAAGATSSILTPGIDDTGTALQWTQSGTCLANGHCPPLR